MTLVGDVKINDAKYILAIKHYVKQVVYCVYTYEDQSDFYSVEKRITSPKQLTRANANAHLLGAYTRSLVSGAVKHYGECDVIRIALDNISYASNYVFTEENVVLNKKTRTERGLENFFEGSDTKLFLSKKTLDGDMIALQIAHGVFSLDMVESTFVPSLKGIALQSSNKTDTNQVLVSTIKTIRRSDLDAVLDMSWYHSGDTILKNYSNVKNKHEFELRVMTPIIKAAIASHEAGEPLVVSLDTETTGLNTLNLEEDNSDRSHCVSIQVSWEDDQGVAIFNDMEHFLNVDIKYTLKRLTELFAKYKGTRTIEYWEEAPDTNMPVRMLDDTSSRVVDNLVRHEVMVDRSWFFLVGHNAPFDRRTCYQTDQSDIWFDADTLQMAFDINPQSVRGNKKLKILTRKFFNHETPELTDILGKGNEDKYKYLVDEEVANIYGCADVDYTRKLWFVLRKLMPDDQWHYYLKQDVDLPNILAISEYYGMMTYPDKVVSLADETAANINILKEAAYHYVGAYQEYTEQRSLLESAYMTGVCTEEEFDYKVQRIQVDPSAVYRFDFKASSLIHVLYEILHYPIFAYTDGKVKKPKVDKYVMKKLVDVKRAEHSTARKLEKDILRYGADRAEYELLKNGSESDVKKAKSMCLISAEDFNKLEYPLALIIQEYASLNKEYTSYYKPIIEQNLEGKMFKGYNMARIETRRIANPLQTIKANLKALVCAYDDDHWLLDFDMSQVEYRIMLSLSGYDTMIDRMKDSEKDFHTETASMVNNIPAYQVSKKQRKKAKSVSFGVPYGLGDRSLCESMFGEVTPDNLVETRVTLDKWKKKNAPIITLLETAREQALEEWKINDDLRFFLDAYKKDPKTKEYLLDETGNKIPKPVGRVTNKLGFYRVFDLTNVGQTAADKARRAGGSYTPEEASIRRKAGNYPIQSYAAEVFRTILTRFYWSCVKEGIADKIIWHMLIHDELLCSVHKSIHPIYIYKLVKEACMITMKGHTNYFVGINIGDTWEQCKDDAREAPVIFVQRMIDRWNAGDFAPEKTDPKFLKNGDPAQGYWFDHPWDFIKPLRAAYVESRIGEVIRMIMDIDNGPIDIPQLLDKFDNYTVRAYVNDYPMNHPVNKEDFKIAAAGNDVYDEDLYYNYCWASRLESWALTQFPEGKEYVDVDGELKHLTRAKTAVHENAAPLDDIDDIDIELQYGQDEDDDYWSFDDDQLGMTYERDTEVASSEYDITQSLDFSREAHSVNDLLYKEPEYQSIKKFGSQLRISYDSPKQLSAIKKVLAPFSCSTGMQVVFRDCLGNLTRWITITPKSKFDEIDKKITEILNEDWRNR